MNKVSLALILSSLATVGFSAESSAQGFKVDPGLQPVKSHVARRRLQIVETAPIVTDTRRPKQAPTQYLIQVPNQPIVQQKTVILQAPGGVSGANGMVYTDGMPPPAGFESNMGSLRGPSGLPATKMGGVPVQTAKRSIRGKLNPVAKPSRALLIKPKGLKKVFKYEGDTDNGSVSAHDSSTVKTRVKAKRVQKFKRGMLLNSK